LARTKDDSLTVFDLTSAHNADKDIRSRSMRRERLGYLAVAMRQG
jgi:hypothetical protein